MTCERLASIGMEARITPGWGNWVWLTERPGGQFQESVVDLLVLGDDSGSLHLLFRGFETGAVGSGIRAASDRPTPVGCRPPEMTHEAKHEPAPRVSRMSVGQRENQDLPACCEVHL